MRLTLRLLRKFKVLKKKYFFFFISIKVLFSQDIAYKNFQTYVQSSNGSVFNIEYQQSYFREKIESSGKFYSKNNMYIYDNEIQCIKYEDGVIQTINKINKQIIYDAVNERDVTIFDILIGKDDNIEVNDSIIEKNGIKIPFTIKELDINGSILTSHINGLPKSIIFMQGRDLKVEIKINNVELDSVFTPPKYDISKFEVINLIE